MADWKTRNEVPDSDDDGEEAESQPSTSESLTISRAPVGIAHNATSNTHTQLVADESEDELTLPGPAIGQVIKSSTKYGQKASSDKKEKGKETELEEAAVTLAGATTTASGANVRIPIIQMENAEPQPTPQSSPLTEISSSPPEIWTLLDEPPPPATVNGDDWGEERRGKFVSEEPTRIDEVISDEIEDIDVARRRSTRKRSAIQLNPYKIENQLYRRSIQNAGIAPVRIAEVDTRSEYSDEYDPEAEGLETREMSFTNIEPSPSGQEGTSNSNVFEIPMDDEPPSLDALLAHPNTQLPRSAQSRSIPQTYSRKRKRAANAALSCEQAKPTESALPDEAPTLRVLSPPPSSQSPGRGSPKRFRYPPTVTPPQLWTPAISSDLRPRKGLIPSENLSGDEDRLITSATPARASKNWTPVVTISSGEESTSGSDEDEIEVVRRRIKGVLPASWLRIDQKKQANVQPHRAHRVGSGSPPRSTRRGVARPIHKRSVTFHEPLEEGQTLPLRPEDETLDSSPGKDEHSKPRQPFWLPQDTISMSETIEVDSDSMEEDHIDPMLPSAERRMRSVGKVGRKLPGSSCSHAAVNGLQRQTKIYDHLKNTKITRKRSKKSRKIPLLSITDFVDRSHGPLPDFLRIALRTTKSRRDHGRQLPYSKVLQLGPPETVDEAQEILSQWRARSLDCFKYASVQSRERCRLRTPLQPITDNVQKRSSSSRDASFVEGVDRSHPAWKKSSKKRQETLETTLARKAVSRPTEYIAERRGPRAIAKPRRVPRPHTISANVFHQASFIPAQLEGEYSHDHYVQSPDVFRQHRRLQPELAHDHPPILHRYLQASQDDNQTIDADSSGLFHLPSSRQSSLLKGRKRQPRRVDIQAPTMPVRYVVRNQLELSRQDVDEAIDNIRDDFKLSGLGSYGTSYSSDFDIEPFPLGSRIGIGSLIEKDFVKQIFDKRPPRDLMQCVAAVYVCVSSVQSQWSCWNDQVSTELGQFFRETCDQIVTFALSRYASRKISDGLEAISAYVFSGMWFLDSVDRSSCLERFGSLLEEISGASEVYYHERIATQLADETTNIAFVVLASRVLVLSYQLIQIAADESVSAELRGKTMSIARKTLRLLVKTIFHNGISDLYQYQQATANCSGHWASEQCSVKAEAFTIAYHVSKRLSSDIWDDLRATEPFSHEVGVRNSEALERKWFNLFVILPFFDIGQYGAVDETSRNDSAGENWPFVLGLVNPVLDAYKKSDHLLEPMLNEYCRAVLARCLVLIGKWRWYNCEIALRALYDFFAKKNLQNLPFEDQVEYPGFLSDFNASALSLRRSDKAFHIFLKILGLGLHKMREIYPERGLRSIAFRLTPNHSRSMPKEQDVRQEDLDALRNHHNLLCLLYLALPPPCRPRLSLVRELIRIEDSHRQACHISIRTWTDIALFQLSTREPVSALERLADWYNDLLAQLIRQHGFARRELELQDGILSSELRDAMISTNQRQVEAVLCDALHSLKRTISKAQSTEAAGALLTRSFQDVFGLFNANVRRINSVLIEGLNVVAGFIVRCNAIFANSESQDFGDWTVFEEYLPSKPESPANIPEDVIKSIYALLSNCLGANTLVDEHLIVSTITTWISVATYQVKHGVRLWSDFLDPYGKESWYSFRQTDQTAKFGSLFFSLLIENESNAYKEYQSLILKYWIGALAERESQIKYQARLTSAILNHDSGNPLLENFPFSRDKVTGLFEISVSDLTSRRVSLISCILSNMAESLLFNAYHDLGNSSLRHDYAELLKTLMKAMKDHYMSLGDGCSVRGAYVEFVQAVVGLLQQHTNHIQPIDRFFTDAKNFPLPVHDPGYVVSRLKSYQVKVATTQGARQLVAFVQSIVERAVLDGHQEYLLNQLQTALQNAFESGNSSRTTLRAFLTRSIVPAYLEAAIQTEHGWVFAQPILQSLPAVLENLLSDMDAASKASVDAVRATIDCLFSHLVVAMSSNTFQHFDQHTRPARIQLASLMYEIIAASLCPLDYCIQLQPWSRPSGLSAVRFFSSFAACAFSQLEGRESLVAGPTIPTLPASAPDPTLRYASTSLQAAIGKWHLRDVSGEYELRGPGGIRKLQTNLGTSKDEKDAFKMVLIRFLSGVERLPSFAELCGRW